MFKVISLTLPENMIQEIDDTLLPGNFSSRSEFFRVIIRKWFDEVRQEPREDTREIVEEVNKFEYGIPPEELEKIKAKAKLRN